MRYEMRYEMDVYLVGFPFLPLPFLLLPSPLGPRGPGAKKKLQITYFFFFLFFFKKKKGKERGGAAKGWVIVRYFYIMIVISLRYIIEIMGLGRKEGGEENK